MRPRRVAIALVAAIVLGLPALALPTVATAAQPPIGHVFIIVLENESASTTFGPGSPAPYLSQTLRSEGAYLPNYYGVGHNSNDNYIAMISGQAPSAQNQADCQIFDDLEPGTIGSYGQAEGTGCVYPSDVQTIADQLDASGMSWRDYNESMGANPAREASACGHPAINAPDNTEQATATDQYATRHNPFVYFHSIIDNTALCDQNVVNLDVLPHDLASAATTPNYVFITPDLCDDGHDAPCANGQPGGLAQADQFLRQWVPQITSSPAFVQQHGLLIITFDEAAGSDTSSCCGEIPGPNSPSPGINGPGGGDVGAVMLSPCIAPGTVSTTPYNHYTMLRSIEDLFGLAHLGYANLPGETSFGSDIFTQSCQGAGGAGASTPPPATQVRSPAIASSAGTSARFPVSWSANEPGARFTVQERQLSGKAGSSSTWQTLLASTSQRSLRFPGRPGQTYEFQVRAVADGAPGAWTSATTIVPTGVHPAGGRYHGTWRTRRVRGAWQGHAIVSSKAGATFALRYVGGELAVIGERSATAGKLRITLDGHARTVSLHASHTRKRQVLYLARVRAGGHRLTIRVVSGTVAIEGYAIGARTG